MAERSRVTQLPGAVVKHVAVPTFTGTAADEVLVYSNQDGAKLKIISAGYIPDEAVTGAATNNFALQFKSKTAAGATDKNITSVKTYASGTDMVQFDQDNLTLSTTAADLEVVNGGAITLDITKNGTGLALPAGLAVVTFQYLE